MTPDFDSMSERFAATPVTENGTPEPEWQRWFAERGRWPGVDLSVERLVVLSAHPDDEVLGVGALLAAAAHRGIDVVTVCLSDGAASHPGSPTLTPEQLADRRRDELASATAQLGLHPSRWCGLPDGALTEHEEEIEVIVSRVLAEKPDVATGLLAVWAHDGHPDHETVGRGAQRVGDRLGVPLGMYPIWMWHWASPDDPAIPWHRVQTFDLDEQALDRKRAAVEAFVTQVNPLSDAPEDAAVLGPHILDRLLRDREFVFV